GAVRIKRLQDELRERNDALDRLSRVDPLTGLYNRRHIDEELDRLVRDAQRNEAALSVLMLDIDHFKRVNDSEGHAGGDRVLREFAERLRTVIRRADIVGRWGGEEFIVVAPRTGEEGAHALAERACDVIRATAMVIGDHGVEVTVSVGCATGLDDAAAL